MTHRLSSFLAGVVVGAAGLYAAMTYHVVRAEDGIHVIPKVASGLGDVYVDIREYGPEQWNDHRSLAAAVLKADKEYLLKDSALSSLRHAARGALESLGVK